MNISFATCERKIALEYIQKVYPNKTITDTPESAGPLLDFIEIDIVRIQYPMMYGSKIQVVPGKNWSEDVKIRQQIIDACMQFHES